MGETKAEGILYAIRDILSSKRASGVISKSVTLTGTVTALPDFKCVGVQTLSSCTITLGGGDAITFAGGLLPCNNANEILVSGSGSLGYLIYIK
jgi:hypothetical protein